MHVLFIPKFCMVIVSLEWEKFLPRLVMAVLKGRGGAGRGEVRGGGGGGDAGRGRGEGRVQVVHLHLVLVLQLQPAPAPDVPVVVVVAGVAVAVQAREPGGGRLGAPVRGRHLPGRGHQAVGLAALRHEGHSLAQSVLSLKLVCS